MRYPTILGAVLFVTAATVTGPATVSPQTVTEQVEQKAEQVWDKTKGAGRDAKTGMRDSWLTSKTKIALLGDARVKSPQVGVETRDGVVTLRGKVDSDEAKAAAASIAGGIEGVTRVRNDLQVVAPESRASVEVADDEITRRVEDGLAKDGRLKKVDVRTDAGVVTLTGDVSSIGAGARASEIAREISGVRYVTNELVYDGTASTRVLAMQRALRDKGYDPGPIDGVMGRRTASALKDYQKSEHLRATGRMDSETAAKLKI
jgi:hyperosmotically inducible protein